MIVKSLYPKLKQNESILKYLPDYGENELPGKDFFFGIASTLFSNEIKFLIKKARANRSINVYEDKDEMIEVSKEMMKKLQDLLLHPNKLI